MNKYKKFSNKNDKNASFVKKDKVYLCHLNNHDQETKKFCERQRIKDKEIQLKKHPWIYIKKWKTMFLLQHYHENSNIDKYKWAYKFVCVDKLTNKEEVCVLRIDRNIRGIKNVEDIAFLESRHQSWENNKSHWYWQYEEVCKHLKDIQKLFNEWVKQRKQKKYQK